MKAIKYIGIVTDKDELLKRLGLVRGNDGISRILDKYKKSRELSEIISNNINSVVFMLDGKFIAVEYRDYKSGNYPDNYDRVNLSDFFVKISEITEVGIPLCNGDAFIGGNFEFSWRMSEGSSKFYYRDDSELNDTYVITSGFIDHLLG